MTKCSTELFVVAMIADLQTVSVPRCGDTLGHARYWPANARTRRTTRYTVKMNSTVAATPAMMKAFGEPAWKSRRRFRSLCTPKAADKALPMTCSRLVLFSDGSGVFIDDK